MIFQDRIQIKGSSNVIIDNMEICNFIGDGIYIDQLKGEEKYSCENVKITNNMIYSCSRQGITIIDGNYIDIVSNQIYGISGVNPQTGIDLEANEEDENIRNVKINNNIFYSLGSKKAVQIYERVYNVEFDGNEVSGTIQINDAREKVTISNNYLRNGQITSFLSERNIETGNIIENIVIINNIMKNYSFDLKDVNQCEIDGNEEEK